MEGAAPPLPRGAWKNYVLFLGEALVFTDDNANETEDNGLRIHISVLSCKGIYAFKNSEDLLKMDGYFKDSTVEYMILHDNSNRIHGITSVVPQEGLEWPWQVELRLGEQYASSVLKVSFRTEKSLHGFLRALNTMGAIKSHLEVCKALGDCDPSSEWLDSLCSGNISTVHILNTSFSVQDLKILADTAVPGVFPKHQVIEHIYFAFVPIAVEHIRYLLKWIRNNANYITHLTLQECQLDDVSLKVLLSGLETCRANITEINLSGNLIQASLRLLSQYAVSAQSIKKLNLSNNKISAIHIESLLTLLVQGGVEYLDLSNNPIGDSGAIFLADILPHCPKLGVLKLNRCQIGNEAMRKLLVAISEAKFEACGLTSLHIEHNILDESIMPNIGLTLSKENPIKEISIGGKFEYTKSINKLEPAIFHTSNIGFGEFTVSFNGGKAFTRTTRPDIRVFVETPVSAFDPEYFLHNLCEAVMLPSMHLPIRSIESHGNRIIVMTLEIKYLPDIIGRRIRALPRSYELKARLLHMYGSTYAPFEGALYEEISDKDEIHERLKSLGIINIDSLSTTDTEDILIARKEDAEDDDYTAPLGDALSSPSRKLQSKHLSLDEKLEMLDKMFDYALEADSDDETIVTFENYDDIDFDKYKKKSIKNITESTVDNTGDILVEGAEDKIPGEIKVGAEDKIPGEIKVGAEDKIPGEIKVAISSVEPGPVSNESPVSNANKKQEEILRTVLTDMETVPIMRYVVQQICNKNVELDEGKLIRYRQNEVVGNHVKILKDIRATKATSNNISEEEDLIAVIEQPPDMLPRAIMRMKMFAAIQNRDADECSALLEEDKRLGLSTLQENDIMSARRFIRQDNAIRTSMKTLIDDKTVPPEMLLNEIGRAAKFGIQDSLVYSAVIEYGKRLNVGSVDAHFADVRFLVQALQQRDIHGIDTAVEGIHTGSEYQHKQIQPLLLVSTDLRKKLQTAHDLLRDSIAIAELHRGQLENLESSILYAAQVKVADDNKLWKQAIKTHSDFAKDQSIAYCLKASIVSGQLKKLISFLENVDSSLSSLPIYKLGVKVVQHTSYLTKTIEVIEDLQKINKLISKDPSSLPRSKNVLVRIRELLEFANRIPTLSDGTFSPFEHIVSWYNNEEAVDGSTEVDEQQIHRNKNNSDEDEDETQMTTSLQGEKGKEGINFANANLVLLELQKVVNALDLKRHWEVTSAIIQSEDEILASQKSREIYTALQLRMSIASEGAMSNLFDETMLNAKAWNIDIPPVHIAKILSANEEVRTGRAKSNFVFANFTLDGPASRMEEKYLMGLGADSPLRLECWEKLRSPLQFRSGSNKHVGSQMVDYSQQMLSFTKASIPTSLTMLGQWESNEAVLIFNSIQRGIRRSKRSPSYFSTMRSLTSRISLASKDLSEEMYIQLAKLLQGNPSPKELEAGWELMSIWLRTKHIDKHFLPTIKHFVYTSAGKLFEQNSRELQIVYRVARFCALILRTYDHFFIPGETSQRFYEFCLQSPKVVSVLYPDNSTREYKVLPFTSTAQFLEDVCATEEQDLNLWKGFGLFFADEDNSVDVGGMMRYHSYRSAWASALKPEDDILWACGQHMLDRKIPIPIRSSGTALKLVLMPTCMLRRQSIGVTSMPGNIFSGRANRIIYFHLLNGIREGQFLLSLESYAFITALIHSIFNQTLPGLLDKSEIYHTMKRCVPLKIFSVQSTKLIIMKHVENFIGVLYNGRKVNTTYLQMAFIEYTKSFPFFGSSRFDNLMVELECNDTIKKFRGSVIASTNGLYALRSINGKLASFIPYKSISAVALSQQDQFYQLIGQNASIRVYGSWRICKNFARSVSAYLSCLIRSTENAVDLHHKEVEALWQKNNLFEGIVVPEPPTMKVEEDF